jgi:hypothetical protein
VYKLTLIAVLGSGLVLAQGMPRQQDPTRNPAAVPQSQMPTTDQERLPATNTVDVQSDIQSALQKSPSLAGANISVRVTDQNVELSGIAPTKAAKKAAGQIAKDHSGGLTVTNHIKVNDINLSNPSENPKTDYPRQ